MNNFFVFNHFFRINKIAKTRKLALNAALFIFTLILLSFINCKNTMAQDWMALREKMVNEQLKTRDIKSPEVLNAMQKVPRHLFVPKNFQKFAYNDRPLPIGLDQTISQPYIVAFMTEQIKPKPDMKVLEIGTGSGYQAAVLAELGCEVYTIELLGELSEKAKKVLADLDYNNVHVMTGNGYLGWPEHAPFDAIIVTAAPENIPPKLIEQLKEGGTMILPVGPVHSLQHLKIVTKKNNKITTRKLMPVRFVPMIDKN